jgi:CDGSH iron-sulfur domain-containing protein 3
MNFPKPKEIAMSEPKIADHKPAVLELEPGTYYWCACGYSAKQPFCDGSHKDKGFAPMQFEVTTKEKHALCLCKHTGTKPHCDGTHQKLK